jgi:hypothetical protein
MTALKFGFSFKWPKMPKESLPVGELGCVIGIFEEYGWLCVGVADGGAVEALGHLDYAFWWQVFPFDQF